ncbi:MAG: methionyl-tRNA formyltransferase [Coriobacteriales bacterium]|jgi:methionyl-tRNA formyltransferase|nr:methionyl-tRNA formyltransferase [Coriobacteriales bacterium]
MQIVFFGTPAFAVTVLERLAAEQELSCVVSKPGSPCATYALAHGIDCCADPEQAPAADVYVTCAYGRILSEEVLGRARLAPLNLHFSLLPKWRGAAPVARAILAGEQLTGVSIMRMVKALDAGPVCAQAPFPVGELGLDELTVDLAGSGAALLSEVLPRLSAGELQWREQDEAAVTYAAKIKKAETLLSPQASVRDNRLRVQASNKSAPARCRIAGKVVRILQADSQSSPLSLPCADGELAVQRLQPEGKRAQSAQDFLNGLHCSTIDWSEI